MKFIKNIKRNFLSYLKKREQKEKIREYNITKESIISLLLENKNSVTSLSLFKEIEQRFNTILENRLEELSIEEKNLLNYFNKDKLV